MQYNIIFKMMKKVTYILFIFILTILLLTACDNAEISQETTNIETTPITEEIITVPETHPDAVTPSEPAETIPPPEIIIRLETSSFPHAAIMNRDEIIDYIIKAKSHILAAQNMIDATTVLQYNKDHPVVDLAQREYELAVLELQYYEELWHTASLQFPVAAQVWRFLRESCGYNAEVTAGIIGNMMTECGGQTLKLEWDLYNSTKHYGLCQWSPVYYPEAQGMSLEEQLQLLQRTIPVIMDGWAGQAADYTYAKFCNLTDVREAAYAFYKIYERPGDNGKTRLVNAEVAYTYFCKTVN